MGVATLKKSYLSHTANGNIGRANRCDISSLPVAGQVPRKEAEPVGQGWRPLGLQALQVQCMQSGNGPVVASSRSDHTFRESHGKFLFPLQSPGSMASLGGNAALVDLNIEGRRFDFTGIKACKGPRCCGLPWQSVEQSSLSSTPHFKASYVKAHLEILFSFANGCFLQHVGQQSLLECGLRSHLCGVY